MTQAWDFVDADILWEARRVGVYGLPIETLELSARAFNCLTYADISTVGQLIKARHSLLNIPNFGRVSLREVRETLQYVHGIDLFGEQI